MSEMHTTKNYFAHGGSPRRPSEASAGVSAACEANGTPGAIGAHGAKTVIGGKLTFLPGATVEGMEGMMESLPTAELMEQKVSCVTDSEATTVAALREDFNGLLAALREAGILSENEASSE